MFASPFWSLNCKCLKCGLILHAPRVKWSRCSWIKTMVNMREVINYKPDILTCCFCILVLLLDHGCQHISFPNIPHLLAQGGFGGGGSTSIAPAAVWVSVSQCKQSSQVFPLRHTIITVIHNLLYLCIYILFRTGQRGAFVLCPEPKWWDENANAPWYIQNSHKWIKGLFLLLTFICNH